MFIRIFMAAILLPIALSSTVSAAANPAANHPSYWGENCVKYEMGGETMKYDAPEGASKVVVKGGPGYVEYNAAPFSGLTAPKNPKNGKNYAISHVIVCSAPVVQPVKPTKATPVAETPVVTPVSTTKQAPAPVTAPAAPAPMILPETGGSAYGLWMSVVAAAIAGYAAKRRIASRFAA